jgi:DNA-binding response OmpR family regulator
MPVIFLTARAAETDRVIGLELGANDYIVKPFFIRELIARVRVQLRSPSVAQQTLRLAGIELDRDSCRVLRHGAEVALTATEFRLLEHLMSRPGMVFSRDQILDAVWGLDKSVTHRTVDVHMLRLRQKLETDPSNPALLLSVRGFGYSFAR